MSRKNGSQKKTQQQELQQRYDEWPAAPASARTLQLFTVSDDAPQSTAEIDASATSGRQVSASSSGAACGLTNKNPRWVQQREQELRSEAIRERMLRLISQIEAEEAKDRPAKRNAWLHEKKMELRRLTFKQPDEIIAAEGYMKKARRKLREARRRQREKDGVDAGDEEEYGEDYGIDGTDSDDSEASARSVGKGKKVDTKKDGKKKSIDKTAEGATAKTKKSIKNGKRDESADEQENDNPNNEEVFNLNPSGRLSRPNPRSPQSHGVDPEDVVKKQKYLNRMGKVIRFPLESGFKLGHKIRKHRDKRKASSAHSGGSGGAEADGGTEWGERVDSGRRQIEQRRRSSTSDLADALNYRRGDDGVRVIVADDSERDADSAREDRSSDTGASDSIPELQESVGKKIRDRLTIRRPRWRSRQSSSGEDGSDAKSEAGSEKSKKNKKKDKEKQKKEKDKSEAKKKSKKKEQQADNAEGVEAEESIVAKHEKASTKKKDKKQKKSTEKNKLEASTDKPPTGSGGGGGQVNSALEFVELESD